MPRLSVSRLAGLLTAFVILLGAEVFNAFLALSQAPDLLALWIGERDFPPYGVLALLLFAYIVLGAVMDELAMILLTLPVFFPVVTALDFGLATTEETAIWFGILVLVIVGVGLAEQHLVAGGGAGGVLRTQRGRGVALRVEVDHQHFHALAAQARREVHTGRGLTHAALLVGDGDHARLVRTRELLA